MVSKGLYKTRKEQGLCVLCGSSELATTVTCQSCREKINHINVLSRRKIIRKEKRGMWKRIK